MIKYAFVGLALLALLVPSLVCAQVIDTKGDELFESRCYEKATKQYLHVFRQNPSNKAKPKMLKRIAESILMSEMKRDTARYFIDLYLEFMPKDVEAYFLSAQAHYHAHDFDKALQMLDSFYVRVSREDQILKADKLNSWIRNCKRMMKDTLQNPIINLGDAINTPNNELNAYIFNDDKTLAFSCDDKFDKEAVINVYNVKTSDHSGLSWGPSKKVSGNINTLNDEYPSGVHADGIFFCSNFNRDFSLFQANYAGNGRFPEVYQFHDPIDLLGSEVAAAYSPSGDTIYFSATSGNGKLDIYYSIRTMNGQWREARPVPGLVNLELSDENYPYLANGGTRLYFASDRDGTMGGYDIFYSDYDKNKYEWGTPVQLPYPINDTYDNMTISFTSNGRYAYVSLIRDDSYGCRDIYAILFGHVVPSSAIIKYNLKMRNAQRKPVPIEKQPRIEIVDASGEVVAIQRMNLKNSSFVVVLDPGTYTLSIEAEGAKAYQEKIVVEEKIYSSEAINKDVTLVAQ